MSSPPTDAGEAGKAPALQDPSDPRGKIPGYKGLLIASSLLLLAMSALTYVWTLDNLFPNVRYVSFVGFEDPALPEYAALPGRVGEPRSALVIQTAENRACAEARKVDLWSLAERWRELAHNTGFSVDYRDESGLPRSKADADVVILPWSLCLDPEHRRRLHAYAKSGGGIVVSGEVTFAGEIARPVEEGHFVTAADRTAPGAALDPGQRLALSDDTTSFGMPAEHSVLHWSDYGLRPKEDARGRPLAASAVSAPGRGRKVWFGFQATRRDELGYVDGVRRMALLWAAGDTVVSVAPWPYAREHGAVLAVDVREPGEAVAETLGYLAERGVPATAFAYSDEVRRSDALQAALSEVSELGSRTDRAQTLEKQGRVRQGHRLRRSRRYFSALADQEVRGLYPPEERFDSLTLEESADSGYGYLVGDAEYDRSYPRFAPAGDVRIALLSRGGVGDDYAHLAAAKEPDANALHADLARVRELGGLYLLAFRPDLLGSEGHRMDLARLLTDLLSGDPWLATAGEVAAWARDRRAITLSLSGDREQVVVHNRSPEAMAGLTLEVFGDGTIPERVELAHLAGRARSTLAAPAASVAFAGPWRISSPVQARN